MAPSAPVKHALPSVIEQQYPSLAAIAHTTDTTYSAARFAPQGYDDLKEQATDAYDSGALRKEYYPKSRKKVTRPGSKFYDWVDIKYTPEQLAQARHKGILQAVYVARRGAAMNMLPEAAWENIYVIDNVTMVGCHLMKGSILSLPSCLEWTDKEVLTEDKKRVVGWKMRVQRMLPSGRPQVTEVEVYEAEWLHMLEGDQAKDVWRIYGPDMLYAACVRRAAKHSFPDRVLGMGTKEEAGIQHRLKQIGVRTEAVVETPNIDAILDDMLEEQGEAAPVDMPVAPSSAPSAITGDASIESPEARLRAELTSATTPAACIELHRRADEIADEAARKQFRMDALTRKGQLGAQQ